MDYVGYGAQVHEELPESRIAIVYKDMDELHKASDTARSNGLRTSPYDELKYCIMMKNKVGNIIIVGFTPSCICSWKEANELWYDDSIQKEEIDTLVRHVAANANFTPRRIPFSEVKNEYDSMFNLDEPDEELDAFIEELACK